MSPFSDSTAQPLFYCRAKYKYAAKDAEELTLNPGDILAVIDDAPHDMLDGWWKGRIMEGKVTKGAAGTFPSMLVEKMATEEVGAKSMCITVLQPMMRPLLLSVREVPSDRCFG